MAIKPKSKDKTVFRCQNCGTVSLQWRGQCSGCEQWNTLVEEREAPEPEKTSRRLTEFSSPVTKLADISEEKVQRRSTGIAEFDRILGGGLWPGSLVLLGGAPGIGKSTLMLQVAAKLATPDNSVLYVSGEESLGQVKGRAARLKVKN